MPRRLRTSAYISSYSPLVTHMRYAMTSIVDLLTPCIQWTKTFAVDPRERR